MQFLSVTNQTTLSELSELVGSRNVESILHINDVDRVPNVGAAFLDRCENIIQDTEEIDPARKATLLNTLTQDSDVFEIAALMSSSGWKLLSSADTLPKMMRVPDTIRLPDSTRIIGNGEPVRSTIYSKVMQNIQRPPHSVDPSIFNEYSAVKAANVLDYDGMSTSGVQLVQWFKVPWGEVTLYSSINGETVEFPVYPEELSDGVKANYSTMPELLYQYEPWQLYTSSGPRSQTYTFSFHRDMWTGDHRDGKANDLIRACMANCYPEYKGSAVNVPQVTLYVAGQALISGVMTDVNVNWDGPLGRDHWYLHCKLDITITEVSQEPLNYTYVRNKPLIG